MREQKIINGRAQYKEYIGREAKEINDAIRHATSTGRPLGSEGFIKKLESILNRELFPKKWHAEEKGVGIIREVSLYFPNNQINMK